MKGLARRGGKRWVQATEQGRAVFTKVLTEEKETAKSDAKEDKFRETRRRRKHKRYSISPSAARAAAQVT